MATGYTHKVMEGEITELREFVLDCARAFTGEEGLPELFEADTGYYDARLAELEIELDYLNELDEVDADIEAAKDHTENVTQYLDRCRDRENKRVRYSLMLEKVRAWELPSEGHEPLREFMVTQLIDSIKFDCDSTMDQYPQAMIGIHWHRARIASVERDIEDTKSSIEKSISVTEEKNKWLRQLRESLGDAETVDEG